MAELSAELYYGGAWHTAPVAVRDPVRIVRGRSDESAQLAAATVEMSLDNSDQTYNPRNPSSALYGLAGRNTPIRLTVAAAYRFVGEVSGWSPLRSLGYDQATGRGEAWTAITAAGIVRRLAQRDTLLDSAARRGIVATAPIAYWPLEDDAASLVGASAVPGVAPMVAGIGFAVGGQPPAEVPKFSAGEGPVGSAMLPTLAEGGRLVGAVPLSTATSWEVHWVMTLTPGQVLAAGASGDEPMLITAYDQGGLTVQVEPSGLTGIDQDLRVHVSGSAPAYAGTGMEVNAGATMYDGIPHHYALRVFQDGADITITLYIDAVLTDSDSDTGTLVPAREVYVGPYGDSGAQMPTAIGHVAVYAPSPSAAYRSAVVDALYGHTGERAGRRIERICAEQGVTLTTTGDLDETLVMGPQTQLTLMAMLTECEQADGGILSEPTDSLGLHYRTRAMLYNQTPALALDYAAGQLAPPLDPVVDDLDVTNDVTVKTPTGDVARAVLDTGPMGTADPPTGVGRYAATPAINAGNAADLPHLASWLLARGTVDETRWPQVTVDLDAAPGLVADAVAVVPGDVITLAGVEPDTASILVGQITETLTGGTPGRRMITYVGVPASPYTVGEVEDSILGRADTDGSELAASFVAGTDTSMSVDVTAGPLWVTGATSTVSYVGAAADDSGATTQTSFSPGWPTAYSPVDGDDAILFLHFGGNSLTASDPAGWTACPGVSNPTTEGTASRAYAWYRRIAAADSAPTITVSGSATGVATLVVLRGGAAAGAGAQIGQNAISSSAGTSLDLPTLTGVVPGSMVVALWSARVPTGTAIPTDITPDPDYIERSDVATSRNTASAQNVRQAASTRAITVAGTLSGDTFSTDQTASLVALAVELLSDTSDHFPLDVRAAGVRLTVTGISGASSPQTFTVAVDPVNGVTKTLPAGTPVSLWNPWRAAL